MQFVLYKQITCIFAIQANLACIGSNIIADFLTWVSIFGTIFLTWEMSLADHSLLTPSVIYVFYSFELSWIILASISFVCEWRIYKDGQIIPLDDSLDYGGNFSHMLGFDSPKMQELMRLYVTIHRFVCDIFLKHVIEFIWHCFIRFISTRTFW